MKPIMKKSELDKIIRRHQHWLKHDCKGWEHMRADLSGANLIGVNLVGLDLQWVNLSGAILTEANMSGTNLFNANLRGAALSHANMSGTNLRWSTLSHANMSGANMHGANLIGADLFGADLTGADMRGTDLSGADLTHVKIYTAIFDKKDEIRKGVVLTKPMKGYKKTAEGVVITAEIPVGAVVYSINGKKCRTNMATIIDTAGHKLLHSGYDRDFTYKRGQKIIIPDFDVRYNVECGTGFHFFRTKKEAKNY